MKRAGGNILVIYDAKLKTDAKLKEARAQIMIPLVLIKNYDSLAARSFI